ncbi:MAG: putative stomatin/prohibitin-family rane protease [Pedosphaera sp.]|nr:putative stomatin/prohibitin-family rane protease [Pedosphaera sp.]
MKIEILMALSITALLVAMVVASRRKTFIVSEGFCGLLYLNGKSLHRISPGKHHFWKSGYQVQMVDMRQTLLTVAGQEVLSQDNVGLKVSAVLTYQIVQAEKATHEVQNYFTHLHNAVQMALRTVVGALPIETLLSERLNIGKQLFALVQPEADRIGIVIHALEVKDVMFSGELKKVFAEVIKAQKEGQAALERARGETAALRNLVNAARMLEGNPALMNLRLLQSIASAGNGSGNTLVMGMPAGFMPVKNGKPENGSHTET